MHISHMILKPLTGDVNYINYLTMSGRGTLYIGQQVNSQYLKLKCWKPEN